MVKGGTGPPRFYLIDYGIAVAAGHVGPGITIIAPNPMLTLGRPALLAPESFSFAPVKSCVLVRWGRAALWMINVPTESKLSAGAVFSRIRAVSPTSTS